MRLWTYEWGMFPISGFLPLPLSSQHVVGTQAQQPYCPKQGLDPELDGKQNTLDFPGLTVSEHISVDPNLTPLDPP